MDKLRFLGDSEMQEQLLLLSAAAASGFERQKIVAFAFRQLTTFNKQIHPSIAHILASNALSHPLIPLLFQSETPITTDLVQIFKANKEKFNTIQLISLLDKLIQTNSINNSNLNSILIPHLIKSIKQNRNIKKLFLATLNSKHLFPALISEKFKTYSILIQSLLFSNLIILDYPQLLTDLLVSKKSSNYLSNLFTEITQLLIKNPKSALCSLPCLLDTFIIEYTKASSFKKYTLSNQSISSTTISPEFNFYLVLDSILTDFTTLYLKSEDIDVVSEILNTFGGLLDVLFNQNVVKGTNDESTRFMIAKLKEFLSFLLGLDLKLEPEIIAQIFKIFSGLIKIDFDIINDHISQVVGFYFIKIHGFKPSNIIEFKSFTLDLFVMYRKSRMMDVLLKEFMAAWLRISSDSPSTNLSSSFIFNLATTLEIFSFEVYSTLQSQVFPIYEILTIELIKNYQPSPQQQKKVKKAKKNPINHNPEPKINDSNCIINLFLSATRSSSRFSTTQYKKFTSFSIQIWSNYILPTLQKFHSISDIVVVGNNYDNAFSNFEIERELIPVLRLHIGLIDCDDEYWSTNCLDETLKLIWGVGLACHSVDLGLFRKIEIVLMHVDRIFYIRQIEDVGDEVRQMIRFVKMKMFGEMINDDDSSPTTANRKREFQTLVECEGEEREYFDEVIVKYLPVLSRFLEVKEIEFILEQIFYSFCGSDEKVSTKFWPMLLNTTVFFEIRSFRDNLLQVYTKCITKCLTDLLIFANPSSKATPENILIIEKTKSNLLKIIKKSTSSATTNNREKYFKKITKFLKITKETPLIKLSKKQTKHPSIKTLNSLLSVIQKYPIKSYLTGQERDSLGAVFLAVDVAVFEFTRRNDGVVGAVDGGVVRGVVGRFLKSREDRLALVGYGVGMFEWMVRSALVVKTGSKIKETMAIVELAISQLIVRLVSSKTSNTHIQSTEYLDQILEIASGYVRAEGIEERRFGLGVLKALAMHVDRLSSLSSDSNISIIPKMEEFFVIVRDSCTKELTIFNERLGSGKEVLECCTNEEFESFLMSLDFLSLYLKIRKSSNLTDVGSALHGPLILLTKIVTNISFFKDLAKVSLSADLNIGRYLVLSSTAMKLFCEYMSYCGILSTQFFVKIVDLMWVLVGSDCDEISKKSILDILTVAFTRIINQVTEDQYLAIIDNYLGWVDLCLKSQTLENDGGASTSFNSRVLVIVKFAGVLINTTNQKVERKSVKKFIPYLLAKLSQVVQLTHSADAIHQVLKTLIEIFSNKFMSIRSSEIALAFQTISILSSPTFSKKLNTTAKFTSKQGELIFLDITLLLLTVVKTRKEQLVKVIPSFIAIVKGLLHCFRAPANAYTEELVRLESERFRRQRDLFESIIDEKKINDFEGDLKEAATTTNKKGLVMVKMMKGIDENSINDPFFVLSNGTPMSLKCAESLIRLFQSISQKQSSSLNTTSTNSSSMESTENRHGVAMVETMMRPFAKHVVYIIAEFIFIQVSDRAIISGSSDVGGIDNRKSLTETLLEGVYYLIDLVGDNESEYLLAALGHGNFKGGCSGSLGSLSGGGGGVGESMGSGGAGKDAGRSLFKHIMSDYSKFYKFDGAV